MEVINSNSYRSNVFQNQPTFQGYVDIKLTKSGFIDLNKLNIEIDLLKDDRIHSRYKWFDDFEDSQIRSASSYQVTQFKIRVCDIKNVSERRG